VNAQSDGRLERGRVRRELLLDAAVSVIATRGVSELTHRSVAAEAAVSLASVTYHFPGIDDLRSAAFDFAGSRVGLAFRALVESQGADVSGIPELTADYVVALVGENRKDTLAVYELILAASHDGALKSVVRELDGRLADLLVPYVGTRATALTVGSSIQGLILTHLAGGALDQTAALREAVADLIGRFGRATNQERP
jgi:DNA-binding transcriptional regulator YbjK